VNEYRQLAALPRLDDALFDQHFIIAGYLPFDLSGTADLNATDESAKAIVQRNAFLEFRIADETQALDRALPTMDRTKFAPASGVSRGAYVLGDTAGKTPEIILMSTGSELSLIVDAKAKLEEKGKAVRIVSMPSMEIFEQQDQAYRDSVLPPNIRRRVAVEAAVAMSWYRWVGPEGDIICMTGFGASGKYEDLEKHFGFTVENVVDRALKVLAR
jgi:transketolase